MMRKNLFLLILFSVFCLQFSVKCFAQQNETLTITTYYPSPYGVYRDLEVQGGSLFVSRVGGENGEMGRLRFVQSDYFPGGGTMEDALIIEKTDDDPTVEGGIVFGFSTSNAFNTPRGAAGWAVNHTPVMVLRGVNKDGVLTGGKVGIGTTDPQYALHIAGIANLLLQNQVTGNSNHIMLSSNVNYGGSHKGQTIHYIFGPYNQDVGDLGALYIAAGRSQGTNEKNDIILYNFSCFGPTSGSYDCNVRNIRLYADTTYATGNVGIGTAAPQQKLEINGNLQMTGATPPGAWKSKGDINAKRLCINGDCRDQWDTLHYDKTSTVATNVWAISHKEISVVWPWQFIAGDPPRVGNNEEIVGVRIMVTNGDPGQSGADWYDGNKPVTFDLTPATGFSGGWSGNSNWITFRAFLSYDKKEATVVVQGNDGSPNVGGAVFNVIYLIKTTS